MRRLFASDRTTRSTGPGRLGLAAIEGDPAVGCRRSKDGDPRIREQAVRMLGRDCRENGQVEYTKPEARKPAAGARPSRRSPARMADDPDAGVRRELILALRNLPTDKVGDALRKLAAVVGRPGPLVSRSPRPGAREAREQLSLEPLRRHALR